MRTLPDGLTGVTGTQRPHHLVGRHVVGTQLVGICAMMVRWLEPKGGGAETPGNVANNGRT